MLHASSDIHTDNTAISARVHNLINDSVDQSAIMCTTINVHDLLDDSCNSADHAAPTLNNVHSPLNDTSDTEYAAATDNTHSLPSDSFSNTDHAIVTTVNMHSILSNSSNNTDCAAGIINIHDLPSNNFDSSDSVIHDIIKECGVQNTEGTITYNYQESNNLYSISEVTEHQNQSLHDKTTDHYIIIKPHAPIKWYKACCGYKSFSHSTEYFSIKILLKFICRTTKHMQSGFRTTKMH